jgi:hypothetical protein
LVDTIKMRKLLPVLILITNVAYAEPQALPTEMGGIKLGQKCNPKDGDENTSLRDFTTVKLGVYEVHCSKTLSKVFRIKNLDISESPNTIIRTLIDRYGNKERVSSDKTTDYYLWKSGGRSLVLWIDRKPEGSVSISLTDLIISDESVARMLNQERLYLRNNVLQDLK